MTSNAKQQKNEKQNKIKIRKYNMYILLQNNTCIWMDFVKSTKKNVCINFDQCNKTTVWSLCWHPNQFHFDTSGLSHSMNKAEPAVACGLLCCCWSVIMCIVRRHCPCACLSKIFSCSRQWFSNSTTRHPSWAGQVQWTHVGSRKFWNNLVKM